MTLIYEEDELNAGKDQVIMSNELMKVIIVPELGGRIADAILGETKFLHRKYPDGVNFGPYTEYGGIEECMGSAPGTLWNTSWRYQKKENSILLQAISRNILIRKLISLDESEPIIKIEYDFANMGNTFSKFTFGIHPEINIGNSHKSNIYHIPSDDKIIAGTYEGPSVKKMIKPSEGWCAVTYEDKVFGQMLSEGVADIIEVYYPRVDTHLVVQPMIYGVGVSPGKRAGFTYMIYMGEGDAEKVKYLYEEKKNELTVKYEDFSKEEIPEELKEIEKVSAQQRPEMINTADIVDKALKAHAKALKSAQKAEFKVNIGKHFGIPKGKFAVDIPKIPDIKLPDISAIVGDAMKNVGNVIDENLKNLVNVIKTTQSHGELSASIISIDHLKGDIRINAWEQDHIGYNIIGSVKQDDDHARFKIDGKAEFDIPKSVSEINLNFVNSNVSISGIRSSLKISGVNGTVDADLQLPEDGQIEISLVTGDINLKVPKDSSCSISAIISGGGEIDCSLQLEEKKSSKTMLNGIIGDGKTKIVLSVIKGRIALGYSGKV